MLGGALSPIDGVDPEDLHIAELLDARRPATGSREVVVATNATTTGEATALYLADSLRERAPERGGHPAGQRPAGGLATSSTPTRSPSGARCAAAGAVSQAVWSAVDDFVVETLVPPDPVLDAALAAADAAGVPKIEVTPAQGRFLNLLVQIQGARSVLEVGTLAGYSTIWLARALPADGRPRDAGVRAHVHAEVAGANIARAGPVDMVELLVGPAIETLPRLTGRSTWCSSTRTRRARPSTSTGRSAWPARAR